MTGQQGKRGGMGTSNSNSSSPVQPERSVSHAGRLVSSGECSNQQHVVVVVVVVVVIVVVVVVNLSSTLKSKPYQSDEGETGPFGEQRKPTTRSRSLFYAGVEKQLVL